MLRRVAVFFLSFLGALFLLLGCAGQCLSHRHWDYRPAGFALSAPKVFLWIGFGSCGGEWVSIESQSANSGTETYLYKWLDKSAVSEEGVTFRRRLLYVPTMPLLWVGLLLLAYPIAVLIRRPCRRNRWRNEPRSEKGVSETGTES
jgi:hypothetical protein